MPTLSSDKLKKAIAYSERFPWVRQMGDGFFDERLDEYFSAEDFYEQFVANDEYRLRFADQSQQNSHKLNKQIKIIREQCGDVRLISDQRLLKQNEHRYPRRSPVVEVIMELPKLLKAQISKVSEEYSLVANKLDSTYPRRLFSAEDGIRDSKEYEYLMQELNLKFNKLCKYDLIDISIIDKQEYNPKYSTALRIYFDDFAEKYKVFQDLIAKLDLFTKILNSRLTFKQIEISREKGFAILDADNKNYIKLSDLSSGEKQEIVLFYNLIFETKKGLLLLVDEPEISLHIVWQKKFLDDLFEVAKHTNLQVIIATHSPQIISNHLDIQIDLGEIYGRQFNIKQLR